MMHPLALTASDAALWATLATTLIAALAAGAVSVIAALKGQAAQSQSAATSARVEAQSNTIRGMQTAVRDIARDMPPTGSGTGSGIAMPAPTPQNERQAAPQPIPVLTAEEAAFVRQAIAAARRRQAEGVVGGNAAGEQ